LKERRFPLRRTIGTPFKFDIAKEVGADDDNGLERAFKQA
jgi:hypothetical protein